MANKLRMVDFWTFKPKEVMESKRNLFECKDSVSSTGSSLLVKVAATHSGVVNSNYRFYRPDRMQDASHQWVPEEGKGFARPVLVEHDKKGDVLGRVRTARYIDESYKWTNDFPTIKDSVFYKTSDKKVDLFKSVDWIVDNLMPLPDYSGLGYIELGLNITNPEAIDKVLRDEYLTVSVGFQTNSAICSICHTDWAADDKCEHRPGQKDEEIDKAAFLICGDFKYEEISFVNFPADPFAGKIAKDALKDSLSRKFFMGLSHDKQQAFVAAAGMSMSDAVLDYDIILVEDKVSKVYDLSKIESQTAFEVELKDEKLTAPVALELKQTLQDWKPESETDKTKRRSLMSTLNAKIKKNGWTGVDSASKESTEVDTEIQAAITESVQKTEDCGCDEIDWQKEQLSDEEKDYFSDEEGLYNEICLEMDEAVKASELTDDQVKDAKLSTENRNKLGSSTFCGPNRSFPVPDCAHVVAARRLIGRYKGGSKDKILACVSRKASSLGCGGKKDSVASQVAEKTDTTQNQDVEITRLVDEAKMGNYAADVLGHYDSLSKSYHKADDDLKGRMRHLHFRVGEHWDSNSSLEWAKQHVKALSKDEVLISSKDLADKEEAVNKLSDEVKLANDAVTAAKATSSEILKGIKKALATQIVIYRSLTGHVDYKGLDQSALLIKAEELSKRHVTSLKDAVADIMSELKWVEPTIVQPTDKVVEPGKSVSDNAQVAQPIIAVDSTSETEAEKLQKQMAKELALRDRLSAMNPRERNLYLADLAYNDAKPVRSN